MSAQHRPPATAAEIERAREAFPESDIRIEDDAQKSACDDGSIWVQAWIYLPKSDEEG